MAALSPLSARFLSPTLVVKGGDTPVLLDIERDGAAVALTGSATLTIYDSSGVVVGAAYAATLSGTTLTATVLGADTSGEDYSGRWLARWDFEVTGDRTYGPTNAAALCLSDLQCPVGPTDLVDRHSQMVALLGSLAVVQKKVTQAWGELLSALYADEMPFWTLRTGGALRPWMLARSAQLCFDDMGTAHANGVVYDRQARRMEALLPGLYSEIKVRLDTDQENTLESRSAPVIDTRGSS